MIDRRVDLERPYGATVFAVTVFGVFFLLLPVAFIVLFSFNETVYFRWPPTGLSLRWYWNFFSSERFMSAARTSLTVTAIVTPLSLIAGLPTALAITRGRFPGRELVAAVLLSPLIVPGVVTGIALLVLFTNGGVGSSLVRLVAGMFLLGLPFTTRALSVNLLGLDPRIEEAARNLGASPWRTFLHVTLPQLKPGLLAGGIFAFVEALDNFSISVFLVDSRTTTMPVEAYSYIRDFDDPTVAAMAALLVLLSVLLVAAIERLVGLERFLRLQ
jgi:putative spermidine/putrescine transport system permease protein